MAAEAGSDVLPGPGRAARRAPRRGRRPVRSVRLSLAGRVEELDLAGHHLVLGVAAGFGVGPAPELEAPGHRHPAPLGEVLGNVLGLGAPGHHVDVDRLLVVAVALAPVDGEGDGADGGAAVGEAKLGVSGQVADELDGVHGVLLGGWAAVRAVLGTAASGRRQGAARGAGEYQDRAQRGRTRPAVAPAGAVRWCCQWPLITHGEAQGTLGIGAAAPARS